MSIERYICMLRAKETSVSISARGVEEVSARDIPALLNSETNGKFKMEWAPYVFKRSHITFERLDNENRFAEMKTMLASDAKLAEFLRFHMKMTAKVWKWNINA